MSWWSNIVDTVKKDLGEFASVVTTDTTAVVKDVIDGKGIADSVGKLLGDGKPSASSSPSDAAASAAGGATAPPQAAVVADRLKRLEDDGEDLGWGDDAEAGGGDAESKAGAAPAEVSTKVESSDEEKPSLDAGAVETAASESTTQEASELGTDAISS